MKNQLSFQSQTLASVFVWILCVLCGAVSYGDEKKGDEPKIPDSVDSTLETKDGVLLRCTYYPGGFMLARENEKEVVREIDGKQVVPVILIHGWEGQRGEWEVLATGLQKLGHAVIVPDLRGHGRSTVQKVNGRDGPEDKELKLDRMTKTDIAAMAAEDIQACKRFLLTENNAGRLNIELLCVVGASEGAIIALNWAATDWSRPVLPTGIKLGRDVKAIVLLSPVRQFKGVTADYALNNPFVRKDLSVMIITGTKSRNYNDARRVFKSFERDHDPAPTDPDERRERQDLFLIEKDTLIDGTNLLAAEGLRINQTIAGFIGLRLVNKRGDHAWADRSNAQGG